MRNVRKLEYLFQREIYPGLNTADRNISENTKIYSGAIEELHPSIVSEAAAHEIVDVLSSAMNDDPSTLYYFQEPDPNMRLGKMKSLEKRILHFGLEHGKVFVAKNGGSCDGACVLMPPGEYPVTFTNQVKAGLLSLPFEIGPGAVMRLVGAPTNDLPQNCWYLFVMGVLPEKQGNGIGSALLKRALETCDERKGNCFLQTFKPENVTFYQKHGFKIVQEIPAANEENGFPQKWTMIYSNLSHQ